MVTRLQYHVSVQTSTNSASMTCLLLDELHGWREEGKGEVTQTKTRAEPIPSQNGSNNGFLPNRVLWVNSIIIFCIVSILFIEVLHYSSGFLP